MEEPIRPKVVRSRSESGPHSGANTPRSGTPVRTGTPTTGKRRPSSQSERERHSKRLEQIRIAAEEREALLKQFRHEFYYMLVSSGLALLSAFCWIISISSDNWLVVEVEDGKASNQTDSLGRVFLSSSSGLWSKCRTMLNQDDSIDTSCNTHVFFPSSEEKRADAGVDDIADFRRTSVCFAIISILMMIMALAAACYTFKNTRYMYKRLAAGIFFLTAGTLVIVLEVSKTSFRFDKLAHEAAVPAHSVSSFGWAYYLSWFVFTVYLLNGIIFIWCSRKRKGDKGISEHVEADGVNIFNRW